MNNNIILDGLCGIRIFMNTLLQEITNSNQLEVMPCSTASQPTKIMG